MGAQGAVPVEEVDLELRMAGEQRVDAAFEGGRLDLDLGTAAGRAQKQAGHVNDDGNGLQGGPPAYSTTAAETLRMRGSCTGIDCHDSPASRL